MLLCAMRRAEAANLKAGDIDSSRMLIHVHQGKGSRDPAAKLVLEPIFEADFDPNAYGYRPKRSAQDAIRKVHELLTPAVELRKYGFQYSYDHRHRNQNGTDHRRNIRTPKA